MKKTITMLLAIIMILSLAACGKGGGDKATDDPNLIVIGDYQALYKGCEIVKDGMDEDTIVMTFDYTNNSKEAQAFEYAIYYEITQAGEELSYSPIGVDNLNFEDLAPGKTCEIKLTYNLVNLTDDVLIAFSNLSDSEKDSLTVKLSTAQTSSTPVSAVAETDLQKWWNGDWYGWWTTNFGEGTLADEDLDGGYWDCCATMTVDADGNAQFIMWDENYSKDDPMAEIEFSISKDYGNGEMGAAISESGYFLAMDINHADIIIDPSIYDNENFMPFNVGYKEDGGSSEIDVYMRPWGQDWSDVVGEGNNMPYDEMLPYYYYDWYLPAVEAGAEMPDVIGGDTGTSASGEVPDDQMEAQTLNPGAANGLIPIGDDEILGVVLPDGFSFNDGWYCYSDSAFTVALWLSDAKVYAEQSDMQSAMDQYTNAKKETIGSYTVYVAEDPETFEGATTKYFVELGDVGGFYGCMVKVSSTQNDMAATQASAIKDMIASIQTVA